MNPVSAIKERQNDKIDQMREFVAAYNNRDIKKLKTILSKDAIVSGFMNAKSGEIESEIGRSNVIARMQKNNWEVWSEDKMVIKSIIGADDKTYVDIIWKLLTRSNKDITLRIRAIGIHWEGMIINIDMIADYVKLIRASFNLIIERESKEIIREYMKYLFREDLLPRLKDSL